MIPADVLEIDQLIAAWNSDAAIVPPGYALGHAHGHNAEADAAIKAHHLAQLAEGARRHVASGHARGLEQAVERANREAKEHFQVRVQPAIEGSESGHPELAQQANAEARELARDVIREFEQRRDRERAEIAGMAERLERSAPPAEGEGGERGVLLDLLLETWDEQENRWNASILYGWATYAELRAGGPALIGELRAAVDQLASDATLSGPLRIGVFDSP